MFRALVTGGSGFIGSNLSIELERQGYEVIALDNFSSSNKQNLVGFKGECITHDLQSTIRIDKKLDIIFHQAAITDPRYPNDTEVYQKNVTGFERIIELAQINEAKLIYASTAGLYGNGPIPMQEDQSKICLSSYAKSKLKMDEMAESLFSKMHIVGLRYFNVFGPNEASKGRPASMIYHLALQMKQGKRPRIFKWGEHVRDHIYVKDVIAANIKALSGKPGVYNVGTGIGTSFNDLVKVLNLVLKTNLEPEYFDMPYDPATYQNNTVADIKKAERLLGFKAKWNLEEAIRDYLNSVAFRG